MLGYLMGCSSKNITRYKKLIDQRIQRIILSSSHLFLLISNTSTGLLISQHHFYFIVGKLNQLVYFLYQQISFSIFLKAYFFSCNKICFQLFLQYVHTFSSKWFQYLQPFFYLQHLNSERGAELYLQQYTKQIAFQVAFPPYLYCFMEHRQSEGIQKDNLQLLKRHKSLHRIDISFWFSGNVCVVITAQVCNTNEHQALPAQIKYFGQKDKSLL